MTIVKSLIDVNHIESYCFSFSMNNPVNNQIMDKRDK
jgi:hypothetical protein